MERVRIKVRGVVQGVGFRPFVYRLALRHGVAGWVVNTSGSVDIEAQAALAQLTAFRFDLEHQLPPAARIDELLVESLPVASAQGFTIRPSEARLNGFQLVPPDIATCECCKAELFDRDDRRFGYPFINCTDCGPRFTIIEDVPYDRPVTTMKSFPLCPECLAEYSDPLNRRFHAQPNACALCGPRYWMTDNSGGAIAMVDVALGTSHFLANGKIGALRGLGGFHLCCDASSSAAVELLRRRKVRPGKPLAVMMRDLAMVRAHCDLSDAESEALTSQAAPIVVVPWNRDRSGVCSAVAPGQRFLGVMLPYTPFHHLLMARFGGPLVMTSGNRSEEPIAISNREAQLRLGEIADFFVPHNRDILNRCDDSVVLCESGIRPLRRARGYAPDPLALRDAGPAILACGGAQKNTVCLTHEREAFVSHHIGDLENVETYEHFVETIERYERLFRVDPVAVAHDLHPDYLSTRFARQWAMQRGVEAVPVQHHHAHLAACMAEHGTSGPVVGLVFDGTGYGPDGTVWGGEVLLSEGGEYRRLAHLELLPLPGGDATIRRPGRMAVSILCSLLGEQPEFCDSIGIPGIGGLETRIILKQIQQGLNCPMTSSAGRLFDGVSALLGVCGEAEYEGQAAIELEMQAHASANRPGELLPIAIEGEEPLVLRLAPLVGGVLAARREGQSVPDIAWRFHRTMSEASFQMALRCCERVGCSVVAATGGVFQNRLLLRLLLDRFAGSGLQLLTHTRVPCNDGSISLGQAYVARALLRGGKA